MCDLKILFSMPFVIWPFPGGTRVLRRTRDRSLMECPFVRSQTQSRHNWIRQWEQGDRKRWVKMRASCRRVITPQAEAQFRRRIRLPANPYRFLRSGRWWFPRSQHSPPGGDGCRPLSSLRKTLTQIATGGNSTRKTIRWCNSFVYHPDCELADTHCHWNWKCGTGSSTPVNAPVCIWQNFNFFVTPMRVSLFGKRLVSHPPDRVLHPQWRKLVALHVLRYTSRDSSDPTDVTPLNFHPNLVFD